MVAESGTSVVVYIKGVRHLAEVRHEYEDGFSVSVPCLWRKFGKRQGLWADRSQVERVPEGTPCCWRCEKAAS